MPLRPEHSSAWLHIKRSALQETPLRKGHLGVYPQCSYTQTVSHGGDTKTKTTLKLREICLHCCVALWAVSTSLLIFSVHGWTIKTPLTRRQSQFEQDMKQFRRAFNMEQCAFSLKDQKDTIKIFSFSKEEHQRTFTQFSTGK